MIGVCPKLSKGTPNSVRLNTNDNVEVFEKYEKKSNTDNLPTCPFQVVIVVMIVNIDYLITHLMIN